MSLIHSSYYKPRIFPINGDVSPAELDRVQSIDPTETLNREKVEEVGRDGVVGYLKTSPSITYSMSQYEYSNIELWQKLVNTKTKGGSGSGVDPINLNDFKTSYFDICAYLTDDDGTFIGTFQYPELRVNGFSINISEPQAIIERSFDFVGENAIYWENDNKYYIYQKEDITGNDTDYEISLDNTATEDPDVSGKYMIRVVRVSASGTSTVLSKSDGDYTETSSKVTVATVSNGDVIKLYYTSSSAPSTIFVENDTDPAGLLGDSAEIYLYIPASGKPSSSDYIYRLQSVAIDVSFEREDQREIGNKDVVSRGINDKTVTITLGRILDSLTIEEVMRGVSSSYGKIDVSKLTDEASLILKIYSDNTKDTFKYGFRASNLSPTELRGGANVNEYVTKEATLEGEELKISANESELES